MYHVLYLRVFRLRDQNSLPKLALVGMMQALFAKKLGSERREPTASPLSSNHVLDYYLCRASARYQLCLMGHVRTGRGIR